MGQRRVNIRLQGRPDVGVTQEFTKALNVHAIFHAASRIGVPHSMEIPVADTAALQQLPVSVLPALRHSISTYRLYLQRKHRV